MMSKSKPKDNKNGKLHVAHQQAWTKLQVNTTPEEY
jgi:hypothetical protein